MTTRSPAAHALAAAVTVALLATAAAAQDDPTPAPASEEAAESATDAEEPGERKVDEKASDKLAAWGKAMHLPVHGLANRISAHASAEGTVLGPGGLDVKIEWTRQGGLDVGVTASEEMKKQLPPEMQKGVQTVFGTWGREALAPIFETPSDYAADYDVLDGKSGETDIVELKPINDAANTEIQRLWFGPNDLCDRRTMILRVDPSDPMLAMFVGAELECSYGYEKIGERHVMKQMSMLTPMGDLQVTYEYAEVTGGPPLLRSMTMLTPFAPDPIEVTFRDHQRDGELVKTKPESEDDDAESGEGEDDAEPGEGEEADETEDAGGSDDEM